MYYSILKTDTISFAQFSVLASHNTISFAEFSNHFNAIIQTKLMQPFKGVGSVEKIMEFQQELIFLSRKNFQSILYISKINETSNKNI